MPTAVLRAFTHKRWYIIRATSFIAAYQSFICYNGFNTHIPADSNCVFRHIFICALQADEK